jgi:hypothetical protein
MWGACTWIHWVYMLSGSDVESTVMSTTKAHQEESEYRNHRIVDTIEYWP